jgi:hypothetical protein
MNRVIRSAAAVLVGAWVLMCGTPAWSIQAIADGENRYPNVGAIMVWRVDDSGKPVELRAFASGTLIRSRVMVTAGHFTAPAKALGVLPPEIRLFASFSGTDARDPATWVPVVGQATHPSMPYCAPPPECDPTDDILVAPLAPGIADVGLVFLERAPANVRPAPLAAPRHAREIRTRANHDRGVWNDVASGRERTCQRVGMGRQAADQGLSCAKGCR